MTALEKVAKAMYEVHQARINVGTLAWNDQDSYVKSGWKEFARAALEALKNPPQYVYDELNKYCSGLGGANWSGALDAILNEKPEDA